MIKKDLILPTGYGVGIDRLDDNEKKVAHLYKLNDDGSFGKPMCVRGYNRGADGYSIFRGHTSKMGICRICMDRALDGLDGVEFVSKVNKQNTIRPGYTKT